MKILLAHSWGYARGGDSTHVDSLADALSIRNYLVIRFSMVHERNRPDPQEAFFAPQVDWEEVDRQRREGGRIKAAWAGLGMWAKSTWNREAARRFSRLLEKEKPDVVHAHHLHHHLTPSILEAAKRRGIPVVWTLHDYELVCPNGLLFTDGKPCDRCLKVRYWEAVRHRCKRDSRAVSLVAAGEQVIHRLLRVHALADALICPSAFLANTLKEFGVGGGRVRVIPNFLPQGWLLASPPLPPSPEAPLLYAGRLSKEKGVDLLLEAASRLPNLRVNIAGEGPAEGELRSRHRELRLGSRVHFGGRLEGGAVRTALDECLAAVVPSRWPENLPFAALEPQARGRAVIGSRLGGLPETVVDGETGWLFSGGNVSDLTRICQEVRGNPSEAAIRGRTGWERARTRFSEEEGVERILAVYREVGARGAGAS